MSIDFCIVNYKTPHLLNRLFESLYADYDNHAYSLFVADNGSNDTSFKIMYDWKNKFQNIDCVVNDNIGYAAACNNLAAMGSSDIVALCNADIWLTSADTVAIQKSFDEDSTVAILGPKQRDERGNITHAGIFGTNQQPAHRGWQRPDPNDEFYRDKVEAVTVSGSAYFVRRSVWNEMTNHPQYREIVPNATGAFLPTRHYYEETWASYFARYLGHRVVYDGRISIGHSWHAASPVGSVEKYLSESQIFFRAACDHFGIERD